MAAHDAVDRALANGALPVCIIHWNRPAECLAALSAFRAQQLPVRFTIVDNGSTLSALEQIAAGALDAELIRLQDNIGFGPAANVGLSHLLKSSEAEYLLVAPHDALPEPGCLQRLLDAMKQHPHAGMSSADYGVPRRQGFNSRRGAYLETCPPAPASWQPALFPHGTLMLFRRRCLEEVGLFDERFFAYGEEHDLGLRALAAGWEVGVVPTAIVRNPIRAASGPVTYYLNLRNSLLVVYKHVGWAGACVRTLVMLANGLLLWFLPRRRLDGHSTRTRLRAILDFWRGRFGPPPHDLGRAVDARGQSA
jgi:GT2 family glycosyltransferase